MSRAKKEQVEARVSEILRIMLDGAESWDIGEFVREKEKEPGSCWFVAEGETPLSYSQIRRYAARAEKQIGDSCRASRKRLIRRHQAQRRNLYAKAVSAGDYRAALAAVRDEAELQGLYPPKGIAVTGRNGGPVVLNVVEQVVGEATAALDTITEEVVTNDHGIGNAANPNDPASPGSAAVHPK